MELLTDEEAVELKQNEDFKNSAKTIDISNAGATTSSIEVSNINKETLSNISEYIYSGEVTYLEKKAQNSFVAAVKYDLKELEDLCEASPCEQLSMKNALDHLKLSSQHGAIHLQRKTVKRAVNYN